MITAESKVISAPTSLRGASSAASDPVRGITRNIAKGTVFGTICSVVRLATRMVTIPIVISHLGLDGYGVWAIIMAVVAYMRLGLGGIKSAFQKYAAEAIGVGDVERTNSLLSTGTMLVFALSGLMLGFAIFSSQIARASGIPSSFVSSASTAIIILALSVMISNGGAVYEAIVMGANRVDIVAKVDSVAAIVEATAIVICLSSGFGLGSMAAVMGLSEMGRVVAFYCIAPRVGGQIRIQRRSISLSAIPELVRFAGSYQLVGILEVIFAGILPVAVLRLFGATAAGAYAVSDRLTWAALTGFTSLLLPLLSGATAVRSRGSKQEIQRLAEKGFKVTLALTVPALAFVAVFGNDIITAWTGRTDGLFKTALWLVCAAALFRSVSLLCLVLYRAAGGASSDLVRQSVRIVGALLAALLARNWEFHALLAGFAVAELAAMIWMVFAVAKQTHGLNVRFLAPDAAKIALSAALSIAAVLLVFVVPVLAADGTRSKAMIRVAVTVLMGAALGWPALRLTKFISKSEQSEVLGFFLQYRRKGLPVAQGS